jgi:hypothetical protein
VNKFAGIGDRNAFPESFEGLKPDRKIDSIIKKNARNASGGPSRAVCCLRRALLGRFSSHPIFF